MARWDLTHVTTTMNCICTPSFKSVAPRVFLAKMTFLAFSHHHGNHFLDFKSKF